MPIPRWTPVLYDIAQALESAREPERRVERVMALLETFVPYDRCALVEVQPMLDRPITIVPKPPDPGEVAALQQRLDQLLALLLEDAEHEAIPAETIPVEAQKLPHADDNHLAVPIFSLGEIMGILFVQRARHAYDEGHLAFLSIVAGQIGAYLSAARAEAERSTLLDQRERDVEFLQLFVGMLGHDLRNPLAAIMSVAQALKAREDERMSKPLDQIMASTERMAAMIQQLLDLTRVRLADGIPVSRKQVALSELCRQAIDEIRAGDPRDTAIELKTHGDTSGMWDGTRLLQVISNLVANAVEHAGDERGVLVSVHGFEDSVAMRINNDGIIEPERLPHIFEPFRGEGVQQGSGSLGLGLFIVKHIVDAHGGTVSVDSAEPEGTTFVTTLPRG
jgi:signal transduction histidine kinase